jgi:hypothetical protein
VCERVLYNHKYSRQCESMFVVALRRLLLLLLFHLIVVEEDDQYSYHEMCIYVNILHCPIIATKKRRERKKKEYQVFVPANSVGQYERDRQL